MAGGLKDPQEILSAERKKGARGLYVSKCSHCTMVCKDFVHFSTLIASWRGC